MCTLVQAVPIRAFPKTSEFLRPFPSQCGPRLTRGNHCSDFFFLIIELFLFVRFSCKQNQTVGTLFCLAFSLSTVWIFAHVVKYINSKNSIFIYLKTGLGCLQLGANVNKAGTGSLVKVCVRTCVFIQLQTGCYCKVKKQTHILFCFVKITK